MIEPPRCVGGAGSAELYPAVGPHTDREARDPEDHLRVGVGRRRQEPLCGFGVHRTVQRLLRAAVLECGRDRRVEFRDIPEVVMGDRLPPVGACRGAYRAYVPERDGSSRRGTIPRLNLPEFSRITDLTSG